MKAIWETDDEHEIAAAMQAFETEVAVCRIYHEAPDDVFELIVLKIPHVHEDRWGRRSGKGGLNVLMPASGRVSGNQTHSQERCRFTPCCCLEEMQED